MGDQAVHGWLRRPFLRSAKQASLFCPRSIEWFTQCHDNHSDLTGRERTAAFETRLLEEVITEYGMLPQPPFQLAPS